MRAPRAAVGKPAAALAPRTGSVAMLKYENFSSTGGLLASSKRAISDFCGRRGAESGEESCWECQSGMRGWARLAAADRSRPAGHFVYVAGDGHR